MVYVGKKVVQAELPDTMGSETTGSRVDAFMLVSRDGEKSRY